MDGLGPALGPHGVPPWDWWGPALGLVSRLTSPALGLVTRPYLWESGHS